MLTKTLLIALLAGCGINTEPPNTDDTPQDYQPTLPENSHFCCSSVDIQTNSGDGCSLISESLVNTCAKVLSCEGGWIKDDGRVTCT